MVEVAVIHIQSEYTVRAVLQYTFPDVRPAVFKYFIVALHVKLRDVRKYFIGKDSFAYLGINNTILEHYPLNAMTGGVYDFSSDSVPAFITYN